MKHFLQAEADGWYDEEIPRLYHQVIAVARKLRDSERWLVTYDEFVKAMNAADVQLPIALRHSALRFAHAIGEIFYIEDENPEVSRSPEFKIVVDVERFSLLLSRIVSSSNPKILQEQGMNYVA